MEKPANYFKILQRLKNIGLRRQLQAYLYPIPNLPSHKDLIEISLGLFPDSVRNKQSARNVAAVLQQLYRMDKNSIVSSITTVAPDTTDYFTSFTSDFENEEEETPRIRSPTPRANRTPRPGAKTPKMPVSEPRAPPEQPVHIDPFYQLFDECGTGLRQPSAGVQFIEPEVQAILSAADAPEIPNTLETWPLEVRDNRLVAGRKVDEGAIFFIPDGVIATVSTLYQAAYYLYSQTEDVQFLLQFVNRVFCFQLGDQTLLFDANCSKTARHVTFSEDPTCELVIGTQLGCVILALRAVKHIASGDPITIADSFRWVRRESMLDRPIAEIYGYKAQYLRQDLRCENALVQIQVQSVSPVKYYQFNLSAENSSLRHLMMRFCQITNQRWDQLKDLPLELVEPFVRVLEMRNLYSGRLEEQAQLRICDILGFW